MKISGASSELKCRTVSDLLDAAAAALGTPKELVQRSAAARAAESGATIDDILASWGGGAPVASVQAAAAEPIEEPAAAEPAIETIAVVDAPIIEPPPQVIEIETEPEETLVPVGLGVRTRTSVRVGAWTGAGLGFVGFLLASAFWSQSAAFIEDTGPIVQVGSSRVLIGVVLGSVVFGAIVAGLSRAAASWVNPAMQLSSSKSSTAWTGAMLGLVLGLIAGVLLTSGIGTPIEGTDGLVQLPVLPTLTVMLIGGAVLGAITASVPQLLGTPVAIDDQDLDEVAAIKTRLGNAIGIPMAAAILLLLLVVPIGYILIQSSHLGSGGASIVAVLIAGGILGFATLAGSRPEMKISFGDFLVALAGVGTVLIIILAVLFYTGADDISEDDSGDDAGVVVRML